jgi:hypothetical protein
MYKYLTEQGKTLQQQPYQQYTGQLVPDINATQQAGVNQSQQYSQAAQPYLQQAGQMTQQAAMGYNPQNYAQGVAGYMNPYMQQAMGATAAQLQNVNQQQQQQLLGNSIQQGAFGGDRGKIAQAALMNQQNLALGQTLSGMANQGYNAAAQNYMTGLQNQGALGAQYGNIGNLAQTAGMTGGQQLATAGAIPYAVQQAQDAANYQQFAQQQAYPWQTLGSLANIASGLGAGQGGTSTSTAPGPNSMSQILGLGTAFLNMSDERTKENIEPIGKSFDGQNIYKFNYKGDPKTNIGLMAQEVEKHNPSAVHKTEGGLRMVDYDAATSHAADRGHFAEGGSSMGGLVPESMERQPYAYGGIGSSQYQFGMTPYSDDPLTQEMAALAKITLGSYLPHISISGSGGGMPLPHATPYEDKPIDTSAITGFSKSLYNKFSPAYVPDANKVDMLAAYQDVANKYSNYVPDQTTFSASGGYAEGGLVARSHHADGDQTPIDDNKTVPANSDFLGNLGSSISKGVGGLFSTNDQPGLIGNLFNGGKPLPEDIRNAIIAGGFATAASRSPFALSAIGEGGLGAMNYLSSQKKLDYDRQKALAEQALRGREIGVEEYKAPAQIDIERQNLLWKQFDVWNNQFIEKYKVDPTDVEHPIKVYQDPVGNEISQREYETQKIEKLKQMGLAQAIDANPAINATRTGHALGGLAGGADDVGLVGSAPVALQDDSSGIRDLAKAALRPSDIADIGAPRTQTAQVVPKTVKDFSDNEYPVKDLPPPLQQIEVLKDQARQLDTGAMRMPFSSDQAKSFQEKASQLRTAAQSLSDRTYYTDEKVPIKYVLGSQSADNPPPPPLDKEQHGNINEDTGAVVTVPINLGYPHTGGHPTNPLPKHAVLAGEDPMYVNSKSESGKEETEFLNSADPGKMTEAKATLMKYAAASKILETGALTKDATAFAAYAKALGFPQIADKLALNKDIGQAQIALKAGIDQAIQTVSSSFSKPTQSEFGIIQSKDSPDPDMQPETNHSIVASRLAATLKTDALRNAWLEAKSNGAQNFQAFQNRWTAQHGREMFEDSANRLLGNFKGDKSDLNLDKFVDGGVYVLPENKLKEKQSALETELYEKKDAQGNPIFQPGDIIQLQGVHHYTNENGESRIKMENAVKLDPNQVYSAMLKQPGLGLGR